LAVEKGRSISFSEGKTLLIDGPASLLLLKGNVSILGVTLKVRERIVVREGKRLPLEVEKPSVLDLRMGENASFTEVDGSTIPPSWRDASDQMISSKKPLTVMVMGAVDSGKTSFCTYLVNKALEKGHNVGIVDADLGQSDVGPPGTIGFSHVTKSVRDLFEMEAEDACFVGVTSPSQAVAKLLNGMATLKDKALGTGVNFLVINTDGWINGEDATQYKVQMVERMSPDAVVGIQQETELEPILNALRKVKIFRVASPSEVKRRCQERRKTLRELSYKKYLKGAKVQSFPLNWVRIEGAPFGTWKPPTSGQMEKVKEILGAAPLYHNETPTALFLILERDQEISEGLMKDLEKGLGKRVKTIKRGEEEGLLVALQDAQRRFLGIGILSSLDYERGVIKVYTPVDESISTICVGQMKLDKQGIEIGLSPVFADWA
jgi:polynucleotide 5'-hydroxyl-kinase GRC3/NOL9